ncbi:uncharacterized protein LOC115632372 [Scaptodrosophila lebanonensis]|uniref:Uncharacterized protein LOC115632372 n=1 Tax=Drosophila lebanonensis TaxID=7225 RepID=A0A6J2UE09_DROLE|nr:uncharacterized protein LOC115632372 [Scaptodrosophila lebanonensis]XP_030385352.1 uncharacterized protein LOC115632372 [Scaptodrosophila lebanonensis]
MAAHSADNPPNERTKTPPPLPLLPIKETASIMMLNNDCLMSVFASLPDLRTEVAVSRVCKRFQAVCLAKWRYSHMYDEFDLERWRELLPCYEDLCYFIRLMQPYIRKMNVSSCLCTLLKDLDEMQIYVLPMVTSFYYDPDDIDCYPSDRSIQKMTYLLPNLRRLRLTTPIQGRYLSSFKQLQELHLYEDQHKDYELQQDYFDDVCTKLVNLKVLDIRLFDVISKLRLNNCVHALQNLTILKLNLASLKSVLHEVLDLPALKQLVVLLDTEWYIPALLNVDAFDHKIREVSEFYKIMERKARQIVGFAVDGYYMPLEPGWDADLPIWSHQKLQRLAICSWTHAEDYLERYTCMSNLRLLCLRNWTYLSDNVLLKFIESCPHLEHLDVSYCRQLTPNFVHCALNIMKRRQHSRFLDGYMQRLEPPLLIYYVLSGFEDYVESKKLKNSPDYKGYIVFMDDFPARSERGLSFVDRGYQFDFD